MCINMRVWGFSVIHQKGVKLVCLACVIKKCSHQHCPINELLVNPHDFKLTALGLFVISQCEHGTGSELVWTK